MLPETAVPSLEDEAATPSSPAPPLLPSTEDPALVQGELLMPLDANDAGICEPIIIGLNVGPQRCGAAAIPANRIIAGTVAALLRLPETPA